jgi:uncharacterized membrane protein
MSIRLDELSVVLSLLLISSIILPAYAEVTSLNTNSAFYKGGSKIHFSGTTLNTDPTTSYITVIIENPNNDFVLLTSGVSNSSHAFDIIVDTSTQENQQKFSLKGVYNATAFITNKTAGKTVNFIFSQDGSPVVPSSPSGLLITSRSYDEIDLSWSVPLINGGATIAGYKIERSDGTNFNVIQNTQSTTYQDKGLISSKQYSYRVSATNSAGTSNPSNVVSGITLAAPQTTGSSGQTNQSNASTNPSQQNNPSQSIDEIIKQRIENAKRLHDLLQSKPKKISFIENVGVVDVIANPSLSSSSPSANNTLSFDSGNMMYILIILAGVGVIIAVLYGKKNKLWFSGSTNTEVIRDSLGSSGKHDEQIEEDYSFMILKNRLAKGEISIEEFNRLKDALKEP